MLFSLLATGVLLLLVIQWCVVWSALQCEQAAAAVRACIAQ